MAVNFELADEEPRMTTDRDEILELLQRRQAIEGWLERLEDQRGMANPKVLERVRNDYEQRLADTLAALATHRDSLLAELAAAEDRLASAEAQRADAGDRLEEGALRNRIGELADEEWEAQREELEAAAESAHQSEREAANDVGRLRELLDQLAARDGAADDGPTIAIADIAELVLEEEVELTSATAEGQGFLADIDRALADPPEDQESTEPAASAPATAEPIHDDEEPPEADTSPKPGLKCPDCGYTNDLSAWFCGVCGADIG